MKPSADERFETMMKHPIPRRRVGIVKLQMVKESQTLYGMGKMVNAEDTVEMIRPLFHRSDREMMLVISVNTRLEPMAAEIAAVGGVSECPVDIRNLFKHALLNNAMGIVCLHNHPSGDPNPSREDMSVTEQIAEAGNLLGIQLLDHIVVGENGFYSMRDSDTLPVGKRYGPA